VEKEKQPMPNLTADWRLAKAVPLPDRQIDQVLQQGSVSHREGFNGLVIAI